MPRYKRPPCAGTVVHLISRFANSEYRLVSSVERDAYLVRLGRSLEQTDWLLLAYVLMDNHVHLCALAGQDPSERLMRGLSSGIARWLNRRQGRSGPVFMDRHRLLLCDPEDTARVIAYIHNNPVRAKVVAHAGDTNWSSHRAYLGLDQAPAWLAIDHGLRLSGCRDATELDAIVRARSGDPRDPTLVGDAIEATRVAVRRSAGGPVEISSPKLRDGQVEHEVHAPAGTSLRPRADVPPLMVLAVVARQTGIPIERVRSSERTREVVNARRLALMTWRCLGRQLVEMAAVLGIGASAASHLLRRNPAHFQTLQAEARRLAGMWIAAAGKVKK